MSLVGPHPIVQEELPRYGYFVADYLIVKPGITGMWQVRGRSDTTYEERVQMDTWYVRNWNVWLDLMLLWKTIKAVIRRKGPIEMDYKLCTVIMPAYNAVSYIEESIQSVLKQTYQNIEFLIIDDCSSDNTEDIIKKHCAIDRRIRFLANDTNLGCAETRNRAIALSRGKYIAFIDSDDIWQEDKLEAEIKELVKRQCKVLYSAYRLINGDSQIIKDKPIPDVTTMEMLLRENYICFSTVLIEADLAKKYRMKKKYFHEDYCYLLDLLRDGIVLHGLNRYLVGYRVSDENRSKNKLKAAKYRWKIYREYLQLGLMDAWKYFILYFFQGIKKYYV